MLIVQDDFNDNIIDTNIWAVFKDLGITVEEALSRLNITFPSGLTGSGGLIYQTNFTGNFDTQIDFDFNIFQGQNYGYNYQSLKIIKVSDQSQVAQIYRYRDSSDNFYKLQIPGISYNVTTSDLTGKLRIFLDNEIIKVAFWNGVDWTESTPGVFTDYSEPLELRIIAMHGGGCTQTNPQARFDNFILNRSENKSKGIQLNGIFEVETAAQAKGIQLTGIFETQALQTKGLQLEGIFEVQSGQVKGIQLKGIFETKIIKTKGLQLEGAFEVQAGKAKGLQLKGIFSIEPPILGTSKGLQLEGIFEVEPETQAKGIQLEGSFEVVTTNTKGLQLTGIFEIGSNKTKGLQLKGTFEIVSQQIQDIAGPFDVINSQVEAQIQDIAGPFDILNSNQVIGILGPFNLTSTDAEYNIGQWEIIGSKKSLKPPYKITIDVIDAAYIQGGEDWQWCFLGSSADEGDGISPQANNFDGATQTDKKFCYLSTDGSVAPPQYRLF